MSGHSKWSSIRRSKAASEAASGRMSPMVAKEITFAARAAGVDPAGNPRLRAAIAAAKSVNMPATDIDRAVKKAASAPAGVPVEEVTYEGYGPAGVAMLVDCATDNRNRASGEIRHIFDKYGGHMAEAGSVSYMFKHSGLIEVARSVIGEDELMELALDAGAEDVQGEGDLWAILTPPAALEAVRAALAARQVPVTSAGLTRLASVEVPLSEREAKAALRLLEMLEHNEEVQNVYANFVLPDELLAKLAQ